MSEESEEIAEEKSGVGTDRCNTEGEDAEDASGRTDKYEM